MHQVLPPRVEDCDESNDGSEMPVVGGDSLQRFCCRLKEDVVDGALILEGDDSDLIGHCEHDVKVWDGKEISLTMLEPLCPCERLTLGAMPIAARVVGDALMSAGIASFEVATQRRRATLFNSTHDVALLAADSAGVQFSIGVTVTAENVRQFQRGTHGVSSDLAIRVHRCREFCSVAPDGRRSNGLLVAQMVLAETLR
ncbi:hypothetical protein BSFA1_86210 (plasmid) [Burkholderia sp. SFA1]|nr:hypothetical protein BSFA1_22820 [Burkholderia sp. SFA1]BBQ03493.1 hypothetical protein BSFA1_86210 [Burkholderia sp. SFA1]